MVPQYKCEDVLMLGYAGGTTAGLIRMLYGPIPITAVDVADCEDYYNVSLVKADARDYVKTCKRPYDAVIVDLFDDGALKPCDFVFTNEFATDLRRIARYIIVHAKESSDLSAYDDLKLVKKLQLNDSVFYYFMVYEIPTLPIR